MLPGTIPCGFNAYNQLFMASPADHWCKIPELQYMLPEQKDLLKNIRYFTLSSSKLKLNPNFCSIPLELIDGKYRYSKCKMRDYNYTDILTNGLDKFEWQLNTAPLIPCKNGWNYELLEGETSIISEVTLFRILFVIIIKVFISVESSVR